MLFSLPHKSHVSQSQSPQSEAALTGIKFDLASGLSRSCNREPSCFSSNIDSAFFFSVFLLVFDLAGNCGQRRQQQDPLLHHPISVQAINISRGGFLTSVISRMSPSILSLLCSDCCTCVSVFLFTSSLLPVLLATFPVWGRGKKKTPCCLLGSRSTGLADLGIFLTKARLQCLQCDVICCDGFPRGLTFGGECG